MRIEVKLIRFLAAIGLIGILPERTMGIGSESCGSFYQDPSCREDCGSCGISLNRSKFVVSRDKHCVCLQVSHVVLFSGR